MPEQIPSKPVVIWASSGYGHNSRRPFVTLHWKDVVQQMSTKEARQLALSILEAAEAAEQDAFLFEYAKAVLEVGDNGAANMLFEFREWRAEFEKREPKE